MTAKIFTIGDSISQGFMSGAAANTNLSYSTLLAEALGVSDYRYLDWDDRFKTKIDLERIFRSLEKKYGSNIRGLEWIGVLPTINNVLDQAEDYFERGSGKVGNPVESPHINKGFHNVAVEGMNVGDAFMVTPNICRKVIEKSKGKNDGYLSAASSPFYRNAYRVLNPKGKEGEAKFGNYSAVKWLKHVAESEGIENVCLWLGANNALGTVLDLNINQTPNDPANVLKADREKRHGWNLWHPNDFRAEYEKLIEKVKKAMDVNTHSDWCVFVGTVPLVTIAPLAKGVGEPRKITDPAGTGKDCLYYQYYTYFPLTLESGKKLGKYLKFRDALFIDKTIIKFNKIIREIIDAQNQQLDRKRFHIVDVSARLSEMAWKRNMGEPTYKFPEDLEYIYPPLDTKYYHVDRNGNIEKGGIFSLDGIHPSAIGQGLIAWEFLKSMQSARPGQLDGASLNWEKIVASDTLKNRPIKLMEELYEHDQLIKFLASIGNIINLKD